ncbi:MAG: zinc ribbon domain-containing protein [Devosia sp.]|uniref:zinc ribbon domain-containing protein n=1 Tax=unclassified Devosia TaxID=196773 RepID=UPI0009296F0E|nr:MULTISPECIES: zinc ribbon domain-containing protein [unclassified Devosia]MBL8598402.1 zinc ribbon domain-containing protein [Devosia sp.]MBN9345223.1 zinc ribbon domain-containing protein [Devosia sp.]OJX46454.1 MAG: hypothetical protein BGO81_03585 [Devosia sp. 66-22]
MPDICQSCSMPMGKDPGHGGTEANGTHSAKYCSLCYRDGRFTQPAFTVAEMQSFCIDRLAEQGMPRVMGWIFTRSLPRLERWRTA